MRQWLYAGLAVIGLGCGGLADSNPSPLHKLCMDACAHIHAKNCYAAPAVDVGGCASECGSIQSFADNPCTDEQAAWYACSAQAKITCEGSSGETPTVNGCEAEKEAVSKCETPGTTCTRAPGSDDICFQFGGGFNAFYLCSEGVSPGPNCLQVSSVGFCCPK